MVRRFRRQNAKHHYGDHAGGQDACRVWDQCPEHHADPTQAYRSIATQNALYAQGRNKPGKRVTNARGGQSAHNYGAAMDFVPVVIGKRTYDVPSTWWQEFGAVAKACGLTW